MVYPHRRRWFRLVLGFVATVGVVSAFLSMWIAAERRQSAQELQVAERLREQDLIAYEVGGPYDSWELRSANRAQGRWRDFARRVLGPRVVVISWTAGDFNDLSALEGLTSLQRINVRSRALQDLKPLVNFPDLRILDLDSTNVTDLGPVARLSHLQRLWLARTRVQELSPLAGLTQLASLDLRATQVSDLTPLAALKKLEWLELDSTMVHDLTPLAGLENLRELFVSRTSVKDLSPLRPLRAMELLSISNTQVTDLAPLAGMTQLKSLTIYNSRLLKDDVAALKRELPNCRIDHFMWNAPILTIQRPRK